jgi:uncharacterized protein YgbK (DUF1537 family)
VRPLVLGVIADDVTGATDIASMLTRCGMDVVQVLGLPAAADEEVEADALVVALKTRTVPAAEAVRESLAAARWLLGRQARQLFFKYCSTFDSTDAGNIGPVAEALLDLAGDEITLACPAYPANGRTVYKGHLFVGDRLLSESGMRHHPLTPMTDPDLVRVLGRQCRRPQSVGLVPLEVVEAGADAIRARLASLRTRGIRLAVTDATADRHLEALGAAAEGLRLLTGGSGIAMGLPPLYRRAGLLPERSDVAPLPPARGPLAVLAGSCSEATRAQVAAMAACHPAIGLDPLALAEKRQTVADVVTAASAALASGPVLVHSTAPADRVAAAQARLGRERASALLEEAMGEIARGLVAAGVRRLVVAGGETSGRVAQALGVRRLRIGPEIAPGVPWTASLDPPHLRVAFKSGNFGGEDFFLTAMEADR